MEHRRFLLLNCFVLAALTVPTFCQTPDIANPVAITQARSASRCQIAAQGCAGKQTLEAINFRRLQGITPRRGPFLLASTKNGVAGHTYGAFWQVGEGFTTTLFLRNKDQQNSIFVNVVLFSHDGTEEQRMPMEVSPNSVNRLDFSKVLSPADVPHWGSLMIEFLTGSATKTVGELVIENYTKGIIFNLGLVGGYRYDTQNSLFTPFWLPDSGTDGTLTLFNLSDQNIQVTPAVTIHGSERPGQEISLAPHETKKLSLRQLLQEQGIEDAEEGSLTVRYTGPVHALDPALLLANPTTGFSLVPYFGAQHKLNPGGQVTWLVPDVILAPDPALGFNPANPLKAFALLSNGTQQPLTPTLVAHIGSTAGSVQDISLPVDTLAPLETRLFDLSAFEKAGILPSGISSLALDVSHEGEPGDLGMTIFSMGQNKDFVFRSEGTVRYANAVAADYWDISGDLVALLTMQNPGDNDIQTRTTLFYQATNGATSSYVLPLMNLPAHGQQLVNLKKLIQARIPDTNGNIIPANTTFGTLNLEVADKNGPGLVWGGSASFDPVRGGYGESASPPNCDFCDSCEDCEEPTPEGGDCVPCCADPSCGCAPPTPVPSQVLVLGDSTQTQNCPFNQVTRLRKILYEIQDQFSNEITSVISMRENVPASTVSSCTEKIVSTGQDCNLNTNIEPGVLGEFEDFLSPGCPNSATNSPCGFTFANQQWQWCPSGSSPTSMGTIGAVNAENTLILVDGKLNLTGTTFPQ